MVSSLLISIESMSIYDDWRTLPTYQLTSTHSSPYSKMWKEFELWHSFHILFLAKSYLLMTQMLPARYGSYLYDVSIYIWIWMWKEMWKESWTSNSFHFIRVESLLSSHTSYVLCWHFPSSAHKKSAFSSQLDLQAVKASSLNISLDSSYYFISLALKVMTKDKYLLFVSSSFLIKWRMLC